MGNEIRFILLPRGFVPITPSGWCYDIVDVTVGINCSRIIPPSSSQVDGPTSSDFAVHKREPCILI